MAGQTAPFVRLYYLAFRVRIPYCLGCTGWQLGNLALIATGVRRLAVQLVIFGPITRKLQRLHGKDGHVLSRALYCTECVIEVLHLVGLATDIPCADSTEYLIGVF